MPRQLDQSVAALLSQLATEGMPPLSEQTVDEARRSTAQMCARLQGKMDPVASTHERSISGPSGRITLRIHRPADAEDSPPVFLFVHGGGWVVGDLDTHDGIARSICAGARCVVVSVEYRRAPENRFPAGLEDVWAALAWVRLHAGDFGADPDRIGIGGDSAGGNLATVAARRATRAGLSLSLEFLIYPVTDHSFDTASYRDRAEGYLLSRDDMRWYWGHYLHNTDDGASPDASPLRAEHLRGMPPTLIVTCEFDPLRDEGVAYADRLREMGCDVAHVRCDDMIHGFYGMAGVIRSVRHVQARCSAMIGDRLRGGATW